MAQSVDSPSCKVHFAQDLAIVLFSVSGTERGVIAKQVFSLEESLTSLNSLESLEMVGLSWGDLHSLKPLENGYF